MSVDNTSAPGDRQGNLALSTKENRRKGKVINFGMSSPDPALAVAMAPYIWARVYVMVRKSRYDRLVSEIGPWILADRRRRAST